VTDPKSGTMAAVAPVAPRGEGVSKVRVLFADQQVRLDKSWRAPRVGVRRWMLIRRNR
jgi:hypothetical protein